VIYEIPVVLSPAVINNSTVVPATTAAPAAHRMSLKLGQSYTIVNDHFGE
jgi:hypothetical protein